MVVESVVAWLIPRKYVGSKIFDTFVKGVRRLLVLEKNGISNILKVSDS